MNRKETIFRHIDVDGVGLEVGPSVRPLAAKKDGFNVHVIDHASREQLLQKYKHLSPELLNAIEEVDYVWKGERFSELTGKKNFYDWVIASHLVEHVPDLVGFINDCDEILKDDGVISLVVPDKRYCFDYHRPISGVAKVIDAHYYKNSVLTPGAVAEQMLYACKNDGKPSWSPAHKVGEITLNHKFPDVMTHINAAWKRLEQGDYVDSHVWCFVPHSFRLLTNDLYMLGLIQVQEIEYFGTTGCEFYISLGRKGRGLQVDRASVMAAIQSEVSLRDSS